MDKSRQNLLEIVDEQKKTIEKYSNKLRDVVAAHKSLIVEKKALEETIKILTDSKSAETNANKSVKDASEDEGKENDNQENKPVESDTNLQCQLDSLLTSFSNLVAEKSHMEECYKNNQKQLLDDKEIIENKCKELQEQVKILTKQLKSYEGKTQNEFSVTKKDSKKSLKGGLKNSKQNQSEDGQDDKSRCLENELLSLQVKNYEKEVNNLRSELEAKRLVYELSEKKLKECSWELSKLQEEMRNLQIEHQAAIQQEKMKAKGVEEHAKKLTAIQEERVVNLETRLAELSETIGSYDRLRLQDQTEIQKLKEHIAFIDIGHKGAILEQEKLETGNLFDYDNIVKQILDLKSKLKIAAEKCGREEDFKNLFCENSNNDNIHSLCKEENNKIKAELELLKNEIKLSSNQVKSGKEVVVLQNQIKNLQEKVRILSEKNKEMEKEYHIQIEQLKKTIKNEKERFKETLAASESDYRGRVWLLEEQLQKQRERSLALLEEKEQEIHTLQSTFQMFLPGSVKKSEDEMQSDSNVLASNQYVDGPHIVHYANELARRDVEISSLRRSKHHIEMTLRDLQKEVATIVERNKEERQSLLEEISRLARCQTREGANLEYLKNVVFSFLLSNDPKSKRHMCNAIAAVLKFSDLELQKVIDHSRNRWWTRSNYL